MKVAVIGAGPAGMTAAYQLAKSGVEVHVFEASSAVGGLAKTVELWGQKVDIGPHRFFSNDTRVNELWLEVVGQDYEMVDRLTRIYYRNKFFFYPLKPMNALMTMGIMKSVICLTSYLMAKLFPPPSDNSFENWVSARFGKQLFNMFFKSYTEKLWGISCKDLNADFAAQRIKKLSLWEAVKNALLGGKGNQLKTLVDQFAYPTGGTGMVYERMANYVGRVHCNRPVNRVIQENNRAIGLCFEDGEEMFFDHIISSMPITQLVNRMANVPEAVSHASAALKFRNTILVFLHVGAKNLFPDNWLYIHADNLKMGRLTNFRNWVPQLYGDKDTTILALEYWCYDKDAFWTDDSEKIIAMASEELRQTGLIQNAEILEGYVHRIGRSYPVYLNGYKENLEIVEQYLSSIDNLSVIGRYGAFKYNNQDHSILMGLLASENILYNATHDLWTINTDYESYQESSTITKTGLVKTQTTSPSIQTESSDPPEPDSTIRNTATLIYRAPPSHKPASKTGEK